MEPVYRRAIANLANAAADAVESGNSIDTVFSLYGGVVVDAVRKTTDMIIPVFYDRGIISIGLDLKVNRAIAVAALIERWMQDHGLKQAKRIIETTRTQVNDIIHAGIQDGEGSEAIARNIRKLGSPSISTVRSRLIARTETHNAALFANQEAAKSTGMELLKKWVSTEDARVRPSHAAVDAQGYIPMDQPYIVGGKKMMRPGDPAGGAEEVINCLHPDSVIDAASPNTLMRHWYDGKIITIQTRSGNKLSVTANHPILTRGGWVAASEVKEGNSVISADLFYRKSGSDLNIENVKPSIEQIFNSLSVEGRIVSHAAVSVNFHGEAGKKDVDIINVDCLLWNRVNSALGDPFKEFRLPSANFGSGKFFALSLLSRSFVEEGFRLISNTFVRGFSEAFSFLFGAVSHPIEHCFGSITRLYARIIEAVGDKTPIPAHSLGNSLNAHSFAEESANLFGMGSSIVVPEGAHGFADGSANPSVSNNFINRRNRNASFFGNGASRDSVKVFCDDVLSVSHDDYSGYVYNLEDDKSYYIGNGIVQHNCRCAEVYKPATSYFDE